MTSDGSLVLYRNLIALVVRHEGGKLEILDESGQSARVREKDISLLYAGNLKRIPSPAPSGDFGTAHEMMSVGTARQPLEWSFLSELVYGVFTPESAVACAREAQKNDLFCLDNGLVYARPSAEVLESRRKIAARAREGETRSRFLEALAASLASGNPDPFLASVDAAKYISELAAAAQGGSSATTASLLDDAKISPDPESVQRALIKAGLREPSHNPWPARAGCAANPPRLEFPSSPVASRDLPRLDLSSLKAFAIDNAWSNDPDDAISFDGEFAWIHVADPAAFIAVDSPVDREASVRGSTLYLPEKTVPLLPAAAVPLLGLGLSDSSLALSFRIRLGEDAGIEDVAIMPSKLHVTRLTYEEADKELVNGYPALVALEELAARRHRKRLANGATDIEFPEVSLKVVNLEPSFIPIPETRSSAVVREMMVLAGEAAARWARARSLPFPYSSQEAPLLPPGLEYEDGEVPLLSRHFARRKAMRASILGTECLAHRGLGLSCYAQVTSPLRRYQDLLAHHQVRAFLAKEAGIPGSSPLDEDGISRRCMLAASGSQATRSAERNSKNHWTAWHLFRHPGWKGTATVLEARTRDAIVLIRELGLETQIRTALPLEPDALIEVKLARVDVPSLDFSFDIA